MSSLCMAPRICLCTCCGQHPWWLKSLLQRKPYSCPTQQTNGQGLPRSDFFKAEKENMSRETCMCCSPTNEKGQYIKDKGACCLTKIRIIWKAWKLPVGHNSFLKQGTCMHASAFYRWGYKTCLRLWLSSSLQSLSAGWIQNGSGEGGCFHFALHNLGFKVKQSLWTSLV